MVFTGLIRYSATILDISLKYGLTIDINTDIVELGDSISINGICLTVVSKTISTLSFSFLEETWKRTSISYLKVGDKVNVDKACTLDNRLDGHTLTGHIDCTGILIKVEGEKWWWKIPKEYKLLNKGSIGINGISLTIVDVNITDSETYFSVCLLPYTINHTTLKDLQIGDIVNIEVEKDCFFNSIVKLDMNVWNDNHGINLATSLSEHFKYKTNGNPHVGCIITKNNKIVSIGAHKKSGTEHAEVLACNTLNNNEIYDCCYVTLEPCCHQGRTGPCVDVLKKYKFNKIVVGILDPDERVKGKGVEYLKGLGYNVIVLNSDRVKESLKEYIHQRTTNNPYSIMKIATSLDGKCGKKDNKYILHPNAIKKVHQFRSTVDGIITSAKTFINDKARLSVRLDDKEEFKYIYIIDRSGRCKDVETYYEQIGHTRIKIVKSLEEAFIESKQDGCIRVCIEVGPTLFTEYLNKVNEVYIYQELISLKENGLYPLENFDMIDFELDMVEKITNSTIIYKFKNKNKHHNIN